MERKSSHQRRQPQVSTPETKSMSFKTTTSQHRPWITLSSSLAVCILILVAYLAQRKGTGPLSSIISSSRIPNGGTRSRVHNHDTSRPKIELHPEEHVYREPVTQHLDWHVTSDYARPDGVQKKVYLINGLFPGPTIEARSGDTLVISVTNDLEDELVSIHWHGLHVQQSMDGAVGITQCPISPGAPFVYNFTIPPDQSGTFWYHAHAGLSRADGLYGGFVVHSPASKSTVRGLMARETPVDAQRFDYDKELLLLIGDWYHRPAPEVFSWYMRAGSFGNEPVPDSLLINGVGNFDCSMAVPARPVDCIAQSIGSSFLELDRTANYRIRIVNTGSLAGLTLIFGREHLELIQLDAVDTEPQQQEAVNSAGILFPGQRMDFILRSPPGTDDGQPSSMTIQLDQGCFNYPNPALNPEQTFPLYPTHDKVHRPEKTTTTTETPRVTNHIDIEQVASSSSVRSHLPSKSQQTHVVYTKIQKLARNHNIPYGFFNHTSWKPQRDPLIALPRQQWDRNQFSISTGPDPVWVDLVVNNLDEGPHPFHLHGHHFYVLTIQQASIGWGSYNPFTDPFPPGLSLVSPAENGDDNNNRVPIADPYDLSRAILRDTVEIPSRAYAVLRFKADNPGVWLFHCHILWHLASGMAMLVDVMGDEAGMEAHVASRGDADMCATTFGNGT